MLLTGTPWVCPQFAHDSKGSFSCQLFFSFLDGFTDSPVNAVTKSAFRLVLCDGGDARQSRSWRFGSSRLWGMGIQLQCLADMEFLSQWSAMAIGSQGN